MAFSLKGDQRAQQRVLGSAGAVASVAIKNLPNATLPSLDGLQSRCEIKRPTEDDVNKAVLDRLFEHSTRTPREAGDEVAEGDQVNLTIVGYSNGLLVPGVARADYTVLLPDDSVFVGLSEELVGVPVGSTHSCEVELGELFEIKALRGKRATLGVRVNAATAVVLPNAEDDAFWQSTGFAQSAAEAVDQIAEGLGSDLEELGPMVAVRAILTEIAGQSTVEVPATLVEAELTRRWREGEGEVFAQMGIGMDEQSQALKAWIAVPELRAEAELQLRILSVAKALVAHFGLQVTQEYADDFYRQAAEAAGKTPAVYGAELAKDPKAIAEIEDILIRQLLSETLLAKFPVEFIDV